MPEQTKRYCGVDVLKAIIRMVTAPRPGGFGLAMPDRVEGLTRTDDQPVVLHLPSAVSGVHALRRWAEVLQDVSVTVEASVVPSGAPSIDVVGRIQRGPVVMVQQYAYGSLPLDPPLRERESRSIELDELRALDDARFGGAR